MIGAAPVPPARLGSRHKLIITKDGTTYNPELSGGRIPSLRTAQDAAFMLSFRQKNSSGERPAKDEENTIGIP